MEIFDFQNHMIYNLTIHISADLIFKNAYSSTIESRPTTGKRSTIPVLYVYDRLVVWF